MTGTRGTRQSRIGTVIRTGFPGFLHVTSSPNWSASQWCKSSKKQESIDPPVFYFSRSLFVTSERRGSSFLSRIVADRNDEKRRDNTERTRADEREVSGRVGYHISEISDDLPILIQVNPFTPTTAVMRRPIDAWVVRTRAWTCVTPLARDDKTMVLVATRVYWFCGTIRQLRGGAVAAPVRLSYRHICFPRQVRVRKEDFLRFTGLANRPTIA